MPKVSKEITNLSAMLSQLSFPEAETKYSDVSLIILNMMNRGLDLSPLAGKMIKLLAVPYSPFKRIVCDYLISYSSKISNLNILATNCLRKDFEDPNPFIRKLVIKTVCQIPCLHELAYQLLPSALCDISSYVRCAAATSCSLLLNDDNLNANQNIIDKLYEMIRDPESSVVCSSLTSLNEILQSEGGIVINSRLAHYLISRISDFQEWNFSAVCIVLKKYLPKDRDELLQFLNAFDHCFLDFNPIIFLMASDLILWYISQMKEGFSKDVLKQITPQLKSILNQSNSDILLEVLENIGQYFPQHKDLFSSFYSLFMCCFCDTPSIKIKKLEIIVSFIDESNVSEISEELLMQCNSDIKEVSTQAIHSFIYVLKNHTVPNNLIGTFVQLLNIPDSFLREEILSALTTVNLDEVKELKSMVLPLLLRYSNEIVSVKEKLSLLKIIKDYGLDITNAPYIIEQFMSDSKCLESEDLMMLMLQSSVKLFLLRPQEMQLLLGQILQTAKKSNSLLLRKQSTIYFYFLQEFSNSDMSVESVDKYKKLFEQLFHLKVL